MQYYFLTYELKVKELEKLYNNKINIIISMTKDCPICIENIRDTGYVVTECGHHFCLKCFIEHIQNNNKCPMCRKSIIQDRILDPPNIIETSDGDDETPIENYMSDVESNLSSDDETPRFLDISDDDSNTSSDIDTSQRQTRIRSR